MVSEGKLLENVNGQTIDNAGVIGILSSSPMSLRLRLARNSAVNPSIPGVFMFFMFLMLLQAQNMLCLPMNLPRF